MKYDTLTMRMQRLRRATLTLVRLSPFAVLGLGFAFTVKSDSLAAAIVELALLTAIAALGVMRFTDYDLQYPLLRSYRSTAALTTAGTFLYITFFQLAYPHDIHGMGRDALILLFVGIYLALQAFFGGWSDYMNCGDDPQWRESLLESKGDHSGSRDAWLVSYGPDQAATLDHCRARMADLVLPTTRMSLPILLAAEISERELMQITNELRKFGATVRSFESGNEPLTATVKKVTVISGEVTPVRTTSTFN